MSWGGGGGVTINRSVDKINGVITMVKFHYQFGAMKWVFPLNLIEKGVGFIY